MTGGPCSAGTVSPGTVVVPPPVVVPPGWPLVGWPELESVPPPCAFWPRSPAELVAVPPPPPPQAAATTTNARTIRNFFMGNGLLRTRLTDQTLAWAGRH